MFLNNSLYDINAINKWEDIKKKRRVLPCNKNGTVRMKFCGQDVLSHFMSNIDELVYPAKTIFVAICYSYWLSNILHLPILYFLSDKNLLTGDSYFIPYSEDKIDYIEEKPSLKNITLDAYNFILRQDLDFLMSKKNTTVEATYKYFKEEFRI